MLLVRAGPMATRGFAAQCGKLPERNVGLDSTRAFPDLSNTQSPAVILATGNQPYLPPDTEHDAGTEPVECAANGRD